MGRKRRVDKAATKIKTAVTLSRGAFQRLGVAAVSEGKSRGAIVEDLIARHLAGYVVSVRSPRPGTDQESNPNTLLTRAVGPSGGEGCAGEG
jgi:hypothetical protein